MKIGDETIPINPNTNDRKRCYTVWTRYRWGGRAGGKVVWLNDKQMTIANIKYPKKHFEPVLDLDLLEEYKKYIDATIE